MGSGSSKKAKQQKSGDSKVSEKQNEHPSAAQKAQQPQQAPPHRSEPAAASGQESSKQAPPQPSQQSPPQSSEQSPPRSSAQSPSRSEKQSQDPQQQQESVSVSGRRKNKKDKPQKPDKAGKKKFGAIGKFAVAVNRFREKRIALDPESRALLIGNVQAKNCPSSDRIVRIFLSSTFTDTRHERDALLSDVFPKLRAWCQKKDYQFQVVDMRWGVHDKAHDDHRTLDLCLKEIERCQALSTGPCFVTLISHKYGYRPLPREIEATEFEKLVKAVKSEDTKNLGLLEKWFQRDDNAVPPTYVLLPVSHHYPDFLSDDENKKTEASDKWWEESQAMHAALKQAASSCLSDKQAHRLKQSVTEAEIRHGLLTDDDRLLKRSLWFYRHIDNIDSVQREPVGKRYKDYQDNGAVNEESRQLQENLKTELKKKLPQDRITQYDVQLDDKNGQCLMLTGPGTTPDDGSGLHNKYIKQFCEDFEQKLKDDIDKAITSRRTAMHMTSLLGEVTQHIRFCQEKCRAFHGRENTLEEIRTYLTGDSDSVFVIHGKSGCGKTSIMAMAAQEAWRLQQGKGAIILRFLGTTPDSTTVSSLLGSIIHQLKVLKGNGVKHGREDIPPGLRERIDLFHECLKETASAEFPVTLLLDSLDQLDPGDGARQLRWLPDALPPGTKLIMSTLPEKEYGILPRLEVLYKEHPPKLYEVPTLGDTDVGIILDEWLKTSRRQLTADQRSLVLEAFTECPLPLFLKLSFDTACRWRSFMPAEDTVLEKTVKDSIRMMFEELEKIHGKILVRRALGYLTISRGGLTETELEDVLSCDEDVLDSVYTHWIPPIRRLPPLLLVRLKADLGQYLVDRGADGVRVFYWYHRQFIETAQQRYCGDANTRHSLHASLADFFAGTWAVRSKPYKTGKPNQTELADRKVMHQPLRFDDSSNLRKLNNLPYHCCMAGQKSMLTEECLLNFDFLLAKLQACGVRSVLDDFSTARKAFSDDADLRTMAETFQLSQIVLQRDPTQLPSQILGRIRSPSETLAPILKKRFMSSDLYLLPNQQLLTPPGGRLVYTLAEHTERVSDLAISDNGRYVVTCSQDRSVCVVDVIEGKRLRKLEEVSLYPERVYLCCNDSVIVIKHMGGSTVAYKWKTHTQLWERDKSCSSFCVCGEDRSLLLFFWGRNTITLHNAETGEKQATIDVPETIVAHFGHGYIVDSAGSNRFAAVAVRVFDCQNIIVISIEERKVIAQGYAMQQKPKTGDDDDDDDDNYETFDVSTLAISQDEKHIICIGQSGDLHFLDLHSLRRVKHYQARRMFYGIGTVRLTADGQYLYYSEGQVVDIWDLHHAKTASYALHTDAGISSVVTTDMKTFVTTSDEDCMIWVWDISRGTQQGQTIPLTFSEAEVVQHGEGKAKESRKKNENGSDDDKEDGSDDEEQEAKSEVDEEASNGGTVEIRSVLTLPAPRYVLMSTTHSVEMTGYLQVYDVAKETVVRKAELPDGLHAIDEMLPADDMSILVRTGRRLKLIDLDKMAVIRKFQGRLPRDVYYDIRCVCLFRKGEEVFVVALTKFRKHLKVYSAATGKVLHIARQTSTSTRLRKMTNLKVNEQGTFAVAVTEDNSAFLVFDLNQQCLAYTVTFESLRQEEVDLGESVLMPDGRCFVYSGQGRVTDPKTGKRPKEGTVFVYDLHDNKITYQVDDLPEDYWLDSYQGYHGFLRPSITGFLNERHVLSARDNVVRLLDIHTGTVLSRMEENGNLYAQQGCPIMVTVNQGYGVENPAITVVQLQKDSFTRLCSFTLDKQIGEVILLKNQTDKFLVTMSGIPEPIVFTLHGAKKEKLLGNQQPLSEYPEIYKGTKLEFKIEKIDEDIGTDDEHDPDDDEPGSDSEDEDSDDSHDDDEKKDRENDSEIDDDGKGVKEKEQENDDELENYWNDDDDHDENEDEQHYSDDFDEGKDTI